MKRRNFLKNAAALATLPALPVGTSATPLPVPAEAYAKAVHWAGLWVHTTAATYQNALGVDYPTATAVFKRLQADGILGLSDGIGVAKAVTPYYEIPQVAARLKKAMAKPVPSTAPKPASEVTRKLPDVVKDAAEALGETDNEANGTSSTLDVAARPTPRPLHAITHATDPTI